LKFHLGVIALEPQQKHESTPIPDTKPFSMQHGGAVKAAAPRPDVASTAAARSRGHTLHRRLGQRNR
jgi:hypothetical protein